MALEIKSEQLFNRVVSTAIQDAITNSSTIEKAKRWERAIDRAVREIIENPYLHYDENENHLVILSSSSNNIYAANGECQCLAYMNGKFPCWHRAAARIWRLYLESENKPPTPAKAAAAAASCRTPSEIPYLKPETGNRPEKLGNIRF